MIEQKRQMELYNSGVKEYSQQQAEAIRMNKEFDKSIATQAMIEQKRQMELFVAKGKEYAAAQAEAIRMNKEMDAAAQKEAATIKKLEEQYALLQVRLNGTKGDYLALQAKFAGASEDMQANIKKTGDAIEEKMGKNAHDAMTKFGAGTVGANRELIVLAHEVVSGNFSRIPGSLMVFAERTSTVGAAIRFFINPLTVSLALLGAFGIALAMGAEEQNKFNSSLAVTQNMAGLTESSFLSMAKGMETSRTSIGAVKDMLGELAASGRYSKEVIEAIGKATIKTADLTHQSAEEIVKQYDGMADGVLEWAMKHNKSANSMTLSTYEQIKSLEEAGKKQEAMKVAVDAFSNAVPNHVSQLGFFSWAWHGLAEKAKEYWHVLMDLGKEDTSGKLLENFNKEADKLKQRIAENKKEVEELKAAGGGVGIVTRLIDESQIKRDEEKLKEVTAKISEYQEKVRKEEADAKKKSDDAAAMQAAVVAKKEQDASFKTFASKEEKIKLELKHEADLHAAIVKGYDIEIEKAQGNQLKISQIKAAQLEEENRYQILQQNIKDKYAEKSRSPREDNNAEMNMLLQQQNEKIRVIKETYEMESQLLQARQRSGIISEKQKTEEVKALAEKAQQDVALIYQKEEEIVKATRNRDSVDAKNHAEKLTKIKEEATKDDIKFKTVSQQMDIEAEGIQNKLIETKWKEVEVIEREAAALANTAKARQLSKSVIAEEMALQAEKEADEARQDGALEWRIQQLERTAAALRNIATATKATEASEAQSALDKLLDPSKAEAFGDAIKNSFNRAGTSVGSLVKALETYTRKQAEVQKQQDLFDKSSVKSAEQQAQINQNAAKAQISSYGDMAAAGKLFFDQGTKGYKALEAAEKTFRAFELAMAVKNFIEKSTLTTAFKGLFVSSKASQVAADTAATKATVANSQVQSAASGKAAILNQGSGDPYSAFARMAAMAAIVAGLGVAISGSIGNGAIDNAKARQDAAGTGSVLGDPSAKSDSISKALEANQKLATSLLSHTISMDNSLKTIAGGISNLTTVLFSANGINVAGSNIKTGTTYNSALLSVGGSDPIGTTILGIAKYIPVVGTLINKLFGTTTSLLDQGITSVAKKLSEVQASGIAAMSYADVNVTKKFLGLTTSNRTSESQSALPDEVSKQFTMIVTGIANSVTMAAGMIGQSGKEFQDKLNNFVVDIGHISTKGLSAEQIQKQFEAVFSKMADDMAKSTVSGFTQFQKVGEGSFQTLVRIAGDLTAVNDVFTMLGYKTLDLSIAGVKASESLIDLYGGIDKLQSVSKSYFDNFYTDIEKNQMATKALSEAMHSLGKELPTSREGFRALVEEAKAAGNDQLYVALMNLSQAFADLVPASQQAANSIEGAKNAMSGLASTAEKWLNIRNSAAKLEDSINQTLGNPTKDPAVRISQLWQSLSSDISPEQKMTLANELKDLIISKYNVEKQAIQSLIEFGKQLRNYVDSLKTGTLSPLTMTEKLLEAKRQYEATLASAQSGDTNAQSRLQSSADTYLQLAQTAFASSDQYREVFSQVTTSLDSLSGQSMSVGERANSIAASELEQLNKLKDFASSMEKLSDYYYKQNIDLLAKQVDVLKDMYNKMGIFDGIAAELAALPADIAAALAGKLNNTGNVDFVTSLYKTYAGKSGSQIDSAGMSYWVDEVTKFGKDYVLKAFQDSVKSITGGATSAPPPAVSNLTTTVLASKLDALTTEVQGLRQDNAQQTGAVITATVMSNQENAQAIVGATINNQSSSWNETNKVSII